MKPIKNQVIFLSVATFFIALSIGCTQAKFQAATKAAKNSVASGQTSSLRSFATAATSAVDVNKCTDKAVIQDRYIREYKFKFPAEEGFGESEEWVQKEFEYTVIDYVHGEFHYLIDDFSNMDKPKTTFCNLKLTTEEINKVKSAINEGKICYSQIDNMSPEERDGHSESDLAEMDKYGYIPYRKNEALDKLLTGFIARKTNCEVEVFDISE